MANPTLYKPEYCERVVNHVLSEEDGGEGGTSLSSFAASIGVSRPVINVWINQHDEFRAACDLAKAHLARKWERRADKVGESGGGNGQGAMIAFALKNFASHDWTEKQDINVSGDINHKHEIDVSALSDSELAALRKVLGE